MKRILAGIVCLTMMLAMGVTVGAAPTVAINSTSYSLSGTTTMVNVNATVSNVSGTEQTTFIAYNTAKNSENPDPYATSMDTNIIYIDQMAATSNAATFIFAAPLANVGSTVIKAGSESSDSASAPASLNTVATSVGTVGAGGTVKKGYWNEGGDTFVEFQAGDDDTIDGNVVYEIKPDEGYEIAEIKDNDTAVNASDIIVNAGGAYYYEPGIGECEITATFRAVAATVSASGVANAMDYVADSSDAGTITGTTELEATVYSAIKVASGDTDKSKVFGVLFALQKSDLEAITVDNFSTNTADVSSFGSEDNYDFSGETPVKRFQAFGASQEGRFAVQFSDEDGDILNGGFHVKTYMVIDDTNVHLGSNILSFSK